MAVKDQYSTAGAWQLRTILWKICDKSVWSGSRFCQRH